MSFRLTRRFSGRPSVGRIFLLAALLFFCFITGVGSVTAQTTDDHGNYLSDATNILLGSSIGGRIDPGDDRDVFQGGPLRCIGNHQCLDIHNRQPRYFGWVA